MISKALPIVTMAVITSTAAYKSLFSGDVCWLPTVMCAIEWFGIVLITADEGSTGCVWPQQDDRNTWREVQVAVGPGKAAYTNPAYYAYYNTCSSPLK